ncbi:MAG: adenine-specific DNA methyltransferase [Candidatus Dojkabacteria bacterium]|nr:MAG: adenine-specific DNA methyltransferase [Candidatus Dojkabacteria bacterium]GIW57393.1 MAG: adenine-specific DNA methyltransferase [Candidatus Dojkabacteria bacterium]
MTKEQKFFKALQDVFVGSKIEGQGGFVNLMRIKSQYYSKIEDILKKDIEKALQNYPSFREELFDKLYSFFSRYFSESGSIYFHSTPFHNNVYERVYTNDQDVILFWKTQMLYYVKTDKIFRSLEVEVDGYRFFFDASKIELKKANEKRDLIYELKEITDNYTIVFEVIYSERGKITKTEEILKKIKQHKILVNEDQLERAFRIFERQSEVDFFIHKNAKAFLQEQFKLWSYQYFWEGAKEWSADRINQLQILRDIAFKIIDFISQFEDELVKIWNKPKFVKNSNYVITLDRINNIELIDKIFNHSGLQAQIKEWHELGIVDETFTVDDVFTNDLNGKNLVEKYQHLPIDTKYFKDLEIEILSLFDDLDNSLDGWLIKSENYQALNTLLPKFKEKVQTIYIDPPFNLDSSDQFLYRTNYKDANWATLLENRLQIAKDWLNEKGSIFVRCDYNGNWIVRCLMDEIFDKNFRNEIFVKRGYVPKGLTNQYLTGIDSIFFYAKDANRIAFKGAKRKIREEDRQWISLDMPGQRKTYELQVRYFFGKPWLPPKGQHWGLSQQKITEYEKLGWIRINHGRKYIDTQDNEVKGMPEYLKEPELLLDTNWTDIKSYETHNTFFATENSEILLKRVIDGMEYDEQSIIMDFFLGSGTTTAVAHKLGRKWVGVEMGEHFYSVVLPRMKKVLAYDKSGISKEKDVRDHYNEKNAGGFFKYYELEQYEETLANCKYEDGDLFNTPGKSPYQEYVFLKDEKMLKALEIDYENDKVRVDLSKLYENIDIAETLSNLTGKWIKKITADEVEFEDGTRVNTKNLDYKLIQPLIWWE